MSVSGWTRIERRQTRYSNGDTFEAYFQCETAANDKRFCEEHFCVGLRLLDGIEPTPAEWQTVCRTDCQSGKVPGCWNAPDTLAPHATGSVSLKRNLPGVSKC